MQIQSQKIDRLVVGTLVGAGFMAGLDLFVVNVAFDDIGRDFGANTSGGPTVSDMSWILNAYAVFYAALLVPFGRLADRYGRRGIFVGGLVLFVGASLACALSPGVWELVAFRSLQAVGAAAMTPTSLSILIAALPVEKRAAGVRLWAATGAVAAAIGPTVGGLLAQISWHWVFLINVPVGLLLVASALRNVQETPADDKALRPDFAGAAVFALAIGLLALGLVKSNDWGWLSPKTDLAFAGSLLAAMYFWFRSGRHEAPVIDPALLRIRSFRYANLAMIAFNAAFGAGLLLAILWLQQVWGYSALRTGIAIAAGPVMVPLTAAFTHRFLPNARPHRLIAAGSVVAAIGTVITALSMTATPSYVADFLPGWIIFGIGVGLNLPNLLAAATHDLPPTQSATGSGIITMARQIGFVIGVSVMFAIVGPRQGLDAVSGYRTTWWVAAAVLLLSALAALVMAPRRAKVEVSA